MGSRAACATFGLLTILGSAPSLQAQQPKLIGAGALYESPVLVVPMLFVVLSDDDGARLRLRQTGWTTSADWTHPQDPDTAFVASIDVTPLFAHASNLVYRAGRRAPDLEFADSALQLSAGMRLRHGPLITSEWRVVALEEWPSGLADAAQIRFWRYPYAGLQGKLAFADVRSDEPFRARWDGIKISLNGQQLVGAQPWGRGQLMLGAGRKLGRVFLRANAFGFLISTRNFVARELVGGSWDALEGSALYGHPYARFRADRGVVANLGADLRLLGSWEISARGAVFVSRDVPHHGEALMTSAVVGGILFFAGASTPDSDLFRGKLASLRVFAGLSAASLFP
jgi:hypothetical protein